MTTQLAPTTRDVLNIAYKIGVALGRKFEASDMTPELRQAAHMYAATYSGDFPYMLDMRARLVAGIGSFFSDVQSKAILNCLMADARKRLEARAPKATELQSPSAPTIEQRLYLIAVPDGRYRVTLPSGDHLALKLAQAPEGSKLAGMRVVSTRINGDEWMGVAHVTPQGELRLWRSLRGDLRGRVVDAIDVLDNGKTEDDWLVAGLAYAAEGSECFICGRDLDTPESLTAGYGPVCAEKHGLPWGAKAVPMSVKLAQASAAPAVDETYEAAVADLAPAVYTPKPFIEDAALTTDRARFAAAKVQAKAEGRPLTYNEIFPEDEAL